MEQLYWITEYAKLLLAYGFVLFLWPSVVFRRFLAGKSRTFRFGFCTTAMVLLVNTVVLVLGLARVLWLPVIQAVFFGVFAVRLVQEIHPGSYWIRDLRSLSGGTLSRRRLALRWWSALWGSLREWLSRWWGSTRGRRLEYALLLMLVAFGTLYFSWGAFDEHSYGFGDQYVHHNWIYALLQGEPFTDGVYPEGMHCMIYLVCACFGISLYSGVLFFAGIQIPILLVSAYLLMKELFRWRFSPLFALALYVSVDQLCINMVFGMSRLSWTLPLEYGLYTLYLAVLFLVRFLKRVRAGEPLRVRWRTRKGWGQFLLDEDLLPFGLAVAVSFAVHFYVTIIAFFLCIGVALLFIRYVFRRGSFLPLLMAVVLAVTCAAAPMAAAVGLGVPLQGSLGWAMEVINGTEGASGGLGGDDLKPAATPTPAPEESPPEETAPAPAGEASPAGPTETTAPGVPAVSQPAAKPSLAERLLQKAKDAPEIVMENSYRELYPGPRGELLIGVTLVVGLGSLILHFWLLGRAFLRRRRLEHTPEHRLKKHRLRPGDYDGYLLAALSAVIVMGMYAATELGLPQLIAEARLCSTLHLFNIMVYVCLIDCLFAWLSRYLSRGRLQLASVGVCVGIYCFTQAAGIFHSYLYFELTRYDAAVQTTNRIVTEYPKQKYTIVSTTDELYQVIETGYHEELLNLLQHQYDPAYTLPTPYVFVFLEKRPIRYAQNHFADGPRWLAHTKYPDYYVELHSASQCPEILHGLVDPWHADQSIRYGSKLSDTASELESRVVLESKAFRWMERFKELYPEVTRVIYEDDDFICYGFTQNPERLFSLGIFVRY